MRLFKEIGNKSLIRGIKYELNKDVVLFGADGMSYFGTLQVIYHERLAVLKPSSKSSSGFVEIMTPSEIIHEPNSVILDLCGIVAKGINISADPFIIETPEVITEQQGLKGQRDKDSNQDHTEFFDRRGSHDLIQWLRKQTGNRVAITTFGGFVFEGVLVSIEDELAILRETVIGAPGMDGSSIENVDIVVVNLEVLTSIFIY